MTLVRWVPNSGSSKLGGIPACYTHESTCPTACPLKNNGCYADYGKVAYHWKRNTHGWVNWSSFVELVRGLPEGQLWRYAVAGDLPGKSNRLNLTEFSELVTANYGRRGFVITHKPLDDCLEAIAARAATALGLTVNVSADSLEHADERAELGLPVVVVLPKDSPRFLKTPAGRKVVVCPAQVKKLTCAECQLCQKPHRKSIIGFRAHGQKFDHWRKRLPVIP